MFALSNFKRILMLAIVVGMAGLTVTNANSAVDYTFKVHNKSSSKIVRILASEDGKKYGNFDVGAGIKAGATMELVWDKSTDSGNCEWHLKAVFADGSESEPAVFDFCEKDLVVEFTD
jgi:hypothetical protein